MIQNTNLTLMIHYLYSMTKDNKIKKCDRDFLQEIKEYYH